jgi:hypothetical protein
MPTLLPIIIDTRRARLFVALAARDLTVEQLATLAGVDRARIHRWHSPPASRPRPTAGRSRGGQPSAVTTEILAAPLGVPAAALEVGGPWGPLVGLTAPV